MVLKSIARLLTISDKLSYFLMSSKKFKKIWEFAVKRKDLPRNIFNGCIITPCPLLNGPEKNLFKVEILNTFYGLKIIATYTAKQTYL